MNSIQSPKTIRLHLDEKKNKKNSFIYFKTHVSQKHIHLSYYLKELWTITFNYNQTRHLWSLMDVYV